MSLQVRWQDRTNVLRQGQFVLAQALNSPAQDRNWAEMGAGDGGQPSIQKRELGGLNVTYIFRRFSTHLEGQFDSQKPHSMQRLTRGLAAGLGFRFLTCTCDRQGT